MLDEFICPKCGSPMDECSGARWQLECPECGAVGGIDYDDDGREYIMIFESGSADIDHVEDVPEGCKACGGPYPDCTTSCPIFDD
jgi:hypothetical protein